jgi:DNA-binding Lrp family transcriptional regulator
VTQSNDKLNALEIALINQYQGGFPVCNNPFSEIACELDSDQTTVIATIQKLIAAGWLTRFGPLYDAAALGGGLTLAAVSAPEADYDRIAEIINQYPQVAHNYRREHQLNMWFVLATEKPEEIQSTIHSIERVAGLKVYNFPKQREFYVGLWLHLSEDQVSTVPLPENQTEAIAYQEHSLDRRIIQLTQAGLPLSSRPYTEIANSLDTDTETVLARMQHMLASGIIRRIGAVPNHYKLGLKANGMSVWDVNERNIAQLGDLIGTFNFVSHCYQRPQHFPEWRYNLFAMVHGHDRAEVDKKVARIANTLGDDCAAYEVLYSSAILKKTGMRLVA